MLPFDCRGVAPLNQITEPTLLSARVGSPTTHVILADGEGKSMIYDSLESGDICQSRSLARAQL